jgi:hypothetical protein
MNALTTFGPVREIAQLALDAIWELRTLGLSEQQVWEYEDRFLELVRIPGGSHFPSRSSSSSSTE